MRREEREDMGYQGLEKRNWTETCLSLGQSSIDMRVVLAGQTKKTVCSATMALTD